MDFFTVFIGYGCIVGGASVGAEDDAVFVHEAYDGGAGFGGEGGDIIISFGGTGGFLGCDEGIAVDIFEGEASSVGFF
jgi:hypothetical protein